MHKYKRRRTECVGGDEEITDMLLNGPSIHIKLVQIFVWAMNTIIGLPHEKDNISLVMII